MSGMVLQKFQYKNHLYLSYLHHGTSFYSNKVWKINISAYDLILINGKPDVPKYDYIEVLSTSSYLDIYENSATIWISIISGKEGLYLDTLGNPSIPFDTVIQVTSIL